jgi:1-acyl-sn-glycerol-3-phosphate acyltransferase
VTSLRLIAAAIRTVVAYLWVGAYVLIIGPPALLTALVFEWPGLLYRLGLFAVRVALAIVGIRYTVEGEEFILSRPAVYCVNHTSNVEPPILFLALRRLTPRLLILYKAELKQLPILGRGFDVVGFVAIQRGNREQSTRAIDLAAERLRAGNAFLVFPEGTRSRTGELLPFKRGAFVLALKAGAPVVPVAIGGARDAMRKGGFVIHPVQVRVRLGPPVETRGLGLDAREDLADSIRGRVHAMLEAIG